jgi:RES domain-containing protein
MFVYRICLSKWSSELKSSGLPARWNSMGKQVIYTAENRSLSCLENLVHRNGLGKNKLYRILIIFVPDNIEIKEITPQQLPKNWKEYLNYSVCQKIGDEWIDSLNSCILKVPSTIITHEHNFLINSLHKDFKKIKIDSKEDFNFDERLILE